MMNKEIVLGFDIGGTKIGVGLVSTDGKILGSRRIENKDTYPEDILPQLVKAAQEITAENNMKVTDTAGFGISAPGPAVPKKAIGFSCCSTIREENTGSSLSVFSVLSAVFRTESCARTGNRIPAKKAKMDMAVNNLVSFNCFRLIFLISVLCYRIRKSQVPGPSDSIRMTGASYCFPVKSSVTIPDFSGKVMICVPFSPVWNIKILPCRRK